MFTLEGFRNTAWFLTCYQFFVYAILSFIHLGFTGLGQRRLLIIIHIIFIIIIIIFYF
jgi:hypothetical protein